MADSKSTPWQTDGGTALLLIDVQNSFFRPDCANFYPEAPSIVANLTELLQTARARQRLIVHVADRHRGGLADYEQNKLPLHCIDGELDAAFVDGFGPDVNAPPGREILLVKRRFSAFFATDLDVLLRENGIKRLVVAGVKTNVCVRATIQDGFAAGYKCLLPREATNSNRPALAAASLEDIDRYMGWVVSMDAAKDALQ